MRGGDVGHLDGTRLLYDEQKNNNRDQLADDDDAEDQQDVAPEQRTRPETNAAAQNASGAGDRI